MNIRYRVTLTADERSQLAALIQGGKAAVRRIKRAQLLLAADAGTTDEVIAATISVGTATVYRTKRRFVEEGLDQALSEEPRPGVERKLSTTEEAMLVATACTKAPAGRARWTPCCGETRSTRRLAASSLKESFRLAKHDEHDRCGVSGEERGARGGMVTMATARVLTRQEQPGRGQGWSLRRASVIVVQYAADSFASSNWRAVVCGCR